jgi:hypothetical protein
MLAHTSTYIHTYTGTVPSARPSLLSLAFAAAYSEPAAPADIVGEKDARHRGYLFFQATGYVSYVSTPYVCGQWWA